MYLYYFLKSRMPFASVSGASPFLLLYNLVSSIIFSTRQCLLLHIQCYLLHNVHSSTMSTVPQCPLLHKGLSSIIFIALQCLLLHNVLCYTTSFNPQHSLLQNVCCITISAVPQYPLYGLYHNIWLCCINCGVMSLCTL